LCRVYDFRMKAHGQQINRVTVGIMVVLSVIALLTVLSGYMQSPQPDEGAAAHIFQLSIAALVPGDPGFLRHRGLDAALAKRATFVTPSRIGDPRVCRALLSGALLLSSPLLIYVAASVEKSFQCRLQELLLGRLIQPDHVSRGIAKAGRDLGRVGAVIESGAAVAALPDIPAEGAAMELG
jgi:hypothetical protein